MLKKDKMREALFNAVPLDADAYYVQGNFTREELTRLRLMWSRMNDGLEKPKALIIVPEEMELKRVPSQVLRQWMDTISGILKERGEDEVQGVQSCGSSVSGN